MSNGDLSFIGDGGGFDPNSMPPQEDFEVIPPDKYPVLIEKAEVKPTKANTGHFIKLTMTVLDGPYKNRKVWDQININNPNPQCVEIGLRTLAALGQALGIVSIQDTSQLVNRRLGRLGEEFTVDLERRRLLTYGRDDLAKKVEWVSDTSGDGLGFDVLSFDEVDESERFIQVKTTNQGKHFPFVVTTNEVRCSEAMASQYHLYRLFRFTHRPRLYVLHGALSDLCRLEPVSYRATVKSSEATQDA